MRDLLSKLDNLLIETALNPKDPKGDYQAKSKALDDLDKDGQTDKSAIQQRRLDLNKEAKSKGVKEDTHFKVGDEFGISFSEDFEISAEIVGLAEDGIVIELDETAISYLSEQGFTFEEGELVNEEKQKGLDGKVCWKGYKRMGTKMKGGKRVDNCVKMGEDQDLEEKSFPFAGKKVGHKEGPAGHLKGKDKRPAKAGDLVGGESIDNEAEGYPSDNDMGIVAGTNNKMTLGQWKQMWQKKMPSADMSLFRFPPNMQGSAIAYFDGWMNTPGARWDPEKGVAEAEYQGRKVPLGKPMKGDVKKSKVYVKNPQGNVVKVNFGDKKMRIKKSNPNRRKSFRARHNCANPGPRHKARYWSCRAW